MAIVRSSNYIICLFAIFIFILNLIDLRPFIVLLFFIFNFHFDLHGYMKAEDKVRTDRGRQ